MMAGTPSRHTSPMPLATRLPWKIRRSTALWRPCDGALAGFWRRRDGVKTWSAKGFFRTFMEVTNNPEKGERDAV